METVENLIENYNKSVSESLSDMPALVGSEKQVSWAEDIRKCIFMNLNEMICNEVTEARSVTSGTIYYKDINKISEERLQAIDYTRKVLENAFKNQSGAGAIIDRRNIFDYDQLESWVSTFQKAKQNADSMGKELTVEFGTEYIVKEWLKAGVYATKWE